MKTKRLQYLVVLKWEVQDWVEGDDVIAGLNELDAILMRG